MLDTRTQGSATGQAAYRFDEMAALFDVSVRSVISLTHFSAMQSADYFRFRHSHGDTGCASAR